MSRILHSLEGFRWLSPDTIGKHVEVTQLLVGWVLLQFKWDR